MDSTEMKELHFEHFQRVTAAIGALLSGCAVESATVYSSLRIL
jgi:hypothetical protein